MWSSETRLGVRKSSAMDELCDFAQGISSLCATVSLMGFYSFSCELFKTGTMSFHCTEDKGLLISFGACCNTNNK